MSGTVIGSALIGLALAILFLRLLAIERRLDRLSRIDAKVDALLRHAGVTFDPYQTIPANVRVALENGQTILAVKLLRQATGVGLKEAKDVIDEVRRRQRDPTPRT